jgi:hypothetical protein
MIKRQYKKQKFLVNLIIQTLRNISIVSSLLSMESNALRYNKNSIVINISLNFIENGSFEELID